MSTKRGFSTELQLRPHKLMEKDQGSMIPSCDKESQTAAPLPISPLPKDTLTHAD